MQFVQFSFSVHPLQTVWTDLSILSKACVDDSIFQYSSQLNFVLHLVKWRNSRDRFYFVCFLFFLCLLLPHIPNTATFEQSTGNSSLMHNRQFFLAAHNFLQIMIFKNTFRKIKFKTNNPKKETLEQLNSFHKRICISSGNVGEGETSHL